MSELMKQTVNVGRWCSIILFMCFMFTIMFWVVDAIFINPPERKPEPVRVTQEERMANRGCTLTSVKNVWWGLEKEWDCNEQN